MHPQRVHVGVLAFALLGCDPGADEDGAESSTGAAEPRALIAAAAWVRVEGADDPFADERPADATCDEAGLNIEVTADGNGFEIDTGLCNYATIQQAALNEASAGDALLIRVWHDDLEADEPATGYMAVAHGDTVVWDLEVPMPASSQLVTDTITLPEDVALGDVISVHVHNHGVNTWSILDLQVQ